MSFTLSGTGFGALADTMLEHARLLAAWFGEAYGVRGFRKQATWYTKGFRDSKTLRVRLCEAASLSELEQILAGIDRDGPFSPLAIRVPRGKSGGTRPGSLPDGYLESLDTTRRRAPTRRTPPRADRLARKLPLL